MTRLHLRRRLNHLLHRLLHPLQHRQHAPLPSNPGTATTGSPARTPPPTAPRNDTRPQGLAEARSAYEDALAVPVEENFRRIVAWARNQTQLHMVQTFVQLAPPPPPPRTDSFESSIGSVASSPF